MGCSSSTQGVTLSALDTSQKLVVVNEADPQLYIPAKLDVYSLGKFELCQSMELPASPQNNEFRLVYGFSSVANSGKPCIYIIGGVYSDGETDAYGSHIWKVDVHEKDMPSVTQLNDIPEEHNGQKYAFCHHGNNMDYIYMLGPEYKCQRLNLDDNEWETMPNLPLPSSDIEAIFNGAEAITLATSDGQLICYEQAGDTVGEWEVKIDLGFPSGLSSMLNNAIYTYSKEENTLYRCDFMTGDIDQVDDHDLDFKMMEKTSSVTSCATGLLFSGYHYSQDTISVLELTMGTQKRGVVTGYLENTSSQHEIFVCDVSR